MSGLSAWLRGEADHIWRRILEHPFVRGLFAGGLDRERFRFYVAQDYNYLVGMMRTYSIIASKAPPWVASKALEIAYGDATVEMENYKRLLPRVGLTMDEVLSMEPAPTNEAYMNFLIATASLGSALEGLVATLPCFWSYAYIAEHYRDEIESNPDPLYREWASVYLSGEYRSLVNTLIDTVDRLYEEQGGNRERLRMLFIRGSKYEYMFWDMAWRMESWPL